MKSRNLFLQSAEGLTFRELLHVARNKVSRKLDAMTGNPQRFTWTFDAVIDSTGPELLLRNYLEHRDLEEYLRIVQSNRRINKAADIGCGFGRLDMLLSEYANEVVGFEREPGLVATARLLLSELQPKVRIVQIQDLAFLPCSNVEFDFAMTFTVLMHLTDTHAQSVIEEIKRMIAPGGFVLLCEQTDPNDQFGDLSNENTLLAHGREISVYERWMKPAILLKISERVIEPTYTLQKVGSYMLFQKPF